MCAQEGEGWVPALSIKPACHSWCSATASSTQACAREGKETAERDRASPAPCSHLSSKELRSCAVLQDNSFPRQQVLVGLLL